jgi:hypothetical protein
MNIIRTRREGAYKTDKITTNQNLKGVVIWNGQECIKFLYPILAFMFTNGIMFFSFCFMGSKDILFTENY